MGGTVGVPRKLPLGESALNDLYGRYKRAARTRRLPFLLTKEKFKAITSANCHYCGRDPKMYVFTESQMKSRRMNGNYRYNGVDRKDNSEGYYFENCVPCCKTCNLGKHNQTYEQFLRYLHDLVSYRRDFDAVQRAD